jgi:hypothetical protein
MKAPSPYPANQGHIYGTVPTDSRPLPAYTDYGAIASDYFTKLKTFLYEGEWTWRSLGLIAGILTFLAGLDNFIYHILGQFVLFPAIFDVYIMLAGILFASFEYKDNFLPDAIKNFIKSELHLMYTPFGRFIVYVFWGLLMITQCTTFYFWVGLYNVIVGGTIFYHTRKAELTLAGIKNKGINESTLQQRFLELGVQDVSQGGLTAEKFAEFCKHFNCNLTYSETASAVAMLDTNHDGLVQMSEILDWLKSSV